MNPELLIRKFLKDFTPYSSARDEFSGSANLWLDANENPYNSDINRYPDPYQKKLKNAVSKLKKIAPENIFLGNGSDEIIDLLFRVFCEPGEDKVLVLPPTYGMYEVTANINDIKTEKVLLNNSFQPDVEKILNHPVKTKMLFICSPNNPSGNLIRLDLIVEILKFYKGIVIVDEAYIDFSESNSVSDLTGNYPNLVVLQTFSKAWGMAGARLGLCFADEIIISCLNKVKLPYNVNTLTAEMVLNKITTKSDEFENQLTEIKKEKVSLTKELLNISVVRKIYDSDANFILVKFDNPVLIYDILKNNGIVVRNRASQPLCEGCLRITIGTPQENKILIKTLKEI